MRDPRAAYRLLVCGGRRYSDWVAVQRVLQPYFNEHGHELIVIEGGAEGADRLARRWANARGLPVATVNALWDFWSNKAKTWAAGPDRNEAMLLLQPNEVLAFPGGNGTTNMIKTAHEYNELFGDFVPRIKVTEVK